MSTKQATKSKTKKGKSAAKNKKKGGSLAVGIICLIILVVLVAAGLIFFLLGKNYYKDKFLAHTKINGVDVGSQSLEEAVKSVSGKTVTEKLIIHDIDNKEIAIDTADFDYKSN